MPNLIENTKGRHRIGPTCVERNVGNHRFNFLARNAEIFRTDEMQVLLGCAVQRHQRHAGD